MVAVVTGFVTTLKVALVVPAATVTELGIEATAFAPLTTTRLTIVSCASVSGKLTVPMVVFPPTTGLGTKLRAEGVIAVTVKVAFFNVPFALAEMVTPVLAVI